MADGKLHKDVEAQRRQLRKKHGLPDPSWSIPSVEGAMFRLASVEEMLSEPQSPNGNGSASRNGSPKSTSGEGANSVGATDED